MRACRQTLTHEVRVTLRCACGHVHEVVQCDLEAWRVHEGQMTDAGTYFPMEVWVRCPACRCETLVVG